MGQHVNFFAALAVVFAIVYHVMQPKATARATQPHTTKTEPPHDRHQRRKAFVSPTINIRETIFPVFTNATAEQISSRRSPQLLRDWPHVQKLEAIRRWNETTLRQKLDGEGWLLRKVRGQFSSPVFVLSRESGGATIGQSREEKPHTRNPGNDMERFDGVPVGEFIDSAHAVDVPYLYYTVPLSDWNPTGLASDAVGWESLRVTEPEVAAMFSASPRDGTDDAHDTPSTPTPESSVSAFASVAVVWLSHPRVTAHAHYDKSHNFIVHILGVKRIFLWPPSMHTALYPYPHAHPMERQSQVNFAEPDTATFPGFAHARALEIVLEPGDVTYIPPFWSVVVEL